MDDLGLKKSKPMRRLENELRPGPLTRFLMAIDPSKSLGQIAGKNFHQNSFTISTILIFSLIISILTTILFSSLNNDDSVGVKEKNFSVVAMAISWFVFANFTFLVVEGTRLFNILLFVTLIACLSIATVGLKQNTSDAYLGISGVVFGVIVLTILLYFYIFTENEEIIRLNTYERENLRKEQIKMWKEKVIKEARQHAKEELLSDVTSKEGIKNRIATAYIDALESKIRKDILLPKDKSKDKDKEKEKKEDKKGE